jgi:phage-related holin
MLRLVEIIATFFYAIAAFTLSAIAITIIGHALYQIFIAVIVGSQTESFIFVILQSVSSVIIAVAIIDVAKYLVDEEVFRNKELRKPKEARETITKIMVIISIAVGMEGLVYIFKAGSIDLSLLVYPAFLIICSSILVISLGIYQKLSVSIEKKEKEC